MQRHFYGTTTSKVAISRIISPTMNNYKASKNKNKFKVPLTSSQLSCKPDAYDLCIKAKAIARSSGAEPALLFALNQLQSPAMKSTKMSNTSSTSKSVLLNTVLTALSREGKGQRFWEVFGAKIDDNKGNWSPQLAATLLNQIAKEMEHLENKIKSFDDKTKIDPDEKTKIDPDSVVVNDEICESIGIGITTSSAELMQRATSIYIEALQTVKIPNHLHLHNAFLKCISRSQNVPFLLWIINKMVPGRFGDLDLKLLGVKEYIPNTAADLKLNNLLEKLEKPVELDVQSLTSILATLARSFYGSMTLAETLWLKFQSISPPIIFDKHCHLALLLVYRNDLSRILRQRKLIRSTSWRERKHARVLEIIKSAGIDLCQDPKFLSIYYEICLNAKLKEKMQEHLMKNPQKIQDKRLLDLIKLSQRGN